MCRSGFLREDGTFAVSGLPTGSYVIEVVNSDYYYEPVRVDINSKGKMRARKLNNVQPTQVTRSVRSDTFLLTNSSVPGHPSSVPPEDEDDGQVLVLPQARGVEDHRHADESDDSDDGVAAAAHHGASKDDERSRNQEGDGADAGQHERAEPGE